VTPDAQKGHSPALGTIIATQPDAVKEAREDLLNSLYMAMAAEGKL